MVAYARSLGWDDRTIGEQFEAMANHVKAHGMRIYDWEAYWQTWCRHYRPSRNGKGADGFAAVNDELRRRMGLPDPWEELLKECGISDEQLQRRSEFDNGKVIDGEATEISTPAKAPPRADKQAHVAQWRREERERLEARVKDLKSIIDNDPTSSEAIKATRERADCWNQLSRLGSD
jgi:hypothetical protein